MNTVVFSKFDHRRFDESGKSVERTGRNYLEVIDGQHRDLLSSHKVMDGTGALKHRRNGGGKVRHKRQTLQDMARPLKQWLYKHRDNPYPTKTEKILLALGSHMTLVQVSNWFANARRRLKNTVRQPDLSWALRIKLYNKYVQGNAERLSISSNDTASDDGENTLQMQASVSNFNRPTHKSVIQDGRGKVHVMASEKVLDSRKRNHSGSFSSNEYEDDLLSPSSSEAEANFTYHTVTLDCGTHPGESSAHKGGRRGNGETYWKELHAAMALTNLAHGKESAAPGTTSCIIQKSSHIAEIKTVKVPTQPRH
ncbi:homeobox protein Mohawk-like isoform X3 [Myxocyprinus asiaticus]|uniref:homeobox protein Mohawk-like isoform X3 n=1 Tax=Myxocyprinus asiaticus TaxID=70543 RepID=UPI002223021B|nr:homeobox protein Mohawk-like isoform X3 [Myxocyprinus asiaticus]